MESLNTLYHRIQKKQHNVGIIGLGYVGLPLVNAICKKGINVFGFDVDLKKIECLNAGKSYIGGISDESVNSYTQKGLFHPTNDFSQIAQVDVVVICVPTPLDADDNPDLSYIENTARTIAPFLKNGSLIVLESTTYPGTVRDVMAPIINQNKPSDETHIYLAYSPEREDPGNINFETSSVPKLVGAQDQGVLDVTVLFYEQFIERVIPVSSIEVAEAAKITENIFRSINIALVNELKVVYDNMGIDVWEVIDAASTKPFGFMPFYPGPGIGGHCIPIDPLYLSWKSKQLGKKTEFIELSARINQSMTGYIIQKLQEGLGISSSEELEGKKILILGVAYKKDVPDQRESPAFPLMRTLQQHGVQITFHDPCIDKILPSRRYNILAGMKSLELTQDNLKQQDATLIITDHSAVDYDLVRCVSPLVIDTRGVYKTRYDNIIKA